MEEVEIKNNTKSRVGGKKYASVLGDVIGFIIVCMAFASLVLGYAYYEQQEHIDVLDKALERRQTTIDNLLWRDSIATKLLPFVDSADKISIIYSVGNDGEPITYRDAIKMLREERAKNLELSNQLSTERLKVKMATNAFGLKFTERGNEVMMTYPSYLKRDSLSN